MQNQDPKMYPDVKLNLMIYEELLVQGSQRNFWGNNEANVLMEILGWGGAGQHGTAHGLNLVTKELAFLCKVTFLVR